MTAEQMTQLENELKELRQLRDDLNSYADRTPAIRNMEQRAENIANNIEEILQYVNFTDAV